MHMVNAFRYYQDNASQPNLTFLFSSMSAHSRFSCLLLSSVAMLTPRLRSPHLRVREVTGKYNIAYIYDINPLCARLMDGGVVTKGCT